MQFDDVDSILSKRKQTPDADKNLADRIIYAAISKPKPHSPSWQDCVSGFFVLFSTRRAIMASFIVMIMIGGVLLQSGYTVTAVNSSQNASLLLQVDEDWAMVLDVYDESLSL